MFLAVRKVSPNLRQILDIAHIGICTVVASQNCLAHGWGLMIYGTLKIDRIRESVQLMIL